MYGYPHTGRPVADNGPQRLATPATNSRQQQTSRQINSLGKFLVTSGGGNGESGSVGNLLISMELPLPLPLRREDPLGRGSSPQLTATAMRSFFNDQSEPSSNMSPRPGLLNRAPPARRRTVGRSPALGVDRPARAHSRSLVDRYQAADWSGAAHSSSRRYFMPLAESL